MTNSILIFGLILSFIHLIIVRNNFSSLIIIIQLFSIVLNISSFISISFYLFGLSILLAFLYPIFNNKKTNREWILLFLLPIFVSFIFSMFNFPGKNIIRLTMLVPIIFFIYSMINYNKYKYEVGIMIIFTMDALLKLLNYFYY